jgi:hypothetical protein
MRRVTAIVFCSISALCIFIFLAWSLFPSQPAAQENHANPEYSGTWLSQEAAPIKLRLNDDGSFDATREQFQNSAHGTWSWRGDVSEILLEPTGGDLALDLRRLQIDKLDHDRLYWLVSSTDTNALDFQNHTIFKRFNE